MQEIIYGSLLIIEKNIKNWEKGLTNVDNRKILKKKVIRIIFHIFHPYFSPGLFLFFLLMSKIFKYMYKNTHIYAKHCLY